MTPVSDHPLQSGDVAPNFHLPAISRDGIVSLDDYRGKSAVMVGLFRGLHCPFCRRHIALLATARDKLAQEGVETVAIVNTPLERARQYFQYRPTPMVLASDPDTQTHQAYGVKETQILPDSTDPRELHWPKTATVAQLVATSINPGGELPEPMNLFAAGEFLNSRDRFEMTEVDKQTHAAHGTLNEGRFLIDQHGVICWAYIESPDNPNQIGRFPGEDEMLTAARRFL